MSLSSHAGVPTFDSRYWLVRFRGGFQGVGHREDDFGKFKERLWEDWGQFWVDMEQLDS